MHFRFFLIGLLITFIIISTLIGVSAYHYYSVIESDRPITPVIIVDTGETTVIRGNIAYDMIAGESLNLKPGDAIETKKDSRAILIWPDRSITRIGERSRIVIDLMDVSPDYTHIKISYNIQRGKVWNTVIRTLLGDSYFEARLPKNNIVVGVRGTIFSVDLERKYIHAVEHAISLRNNNNKSIILFPGEIVDSENILIKRGKELLDTAWTSYNTLRDVDYLKARLEAVSTRINILSGQATSWNPLDQFTRWILSHFTKFRDIEISQAISLGNIDDLSQEAKNALLPYYQSLSGRGLEREREIIRGYIRKFATGSLINDLFRQSLWDSLNSKTLLEGVKGSLENSGENIEIIKNWIETEGVNSTKKLLENFSGSLKKMGF